VIAGSLKGRRLDAPSGLRVRPTSDRAREALFDILGPMVRGASFLDLFSGSGAVGIEARSRGAERVVLVENDRTALGVLDKNLESLGIAGQIAVVRALWPRALAQAARLAGPFDIVFADPPYALADYPAILESLAPSPPGPGTPRLLAPDPLIILEHEDRADVPAESPDFRLQRRAVYGRVAFGFYRSRA
jgi:16S rRNA (guanine(966)-N(2))-methyltransferase RsmD